MEDGKPSGGASSWRRSCGIEDEQGRHAFGSYHGSGTLQLPLSLHSGWWECWATLWNGREPSVGCMVSREGEVIKLKVRDGCPEVTEAQALSLIARIENRKLEMLKQSVDSSKAKIRESVIALNKTWFDHLLTYCDSEAGTDAWQTIQSAPFPTQPNVLRLKLACENRFCVCENQPFARPRESAPGPWNSS